MPVLGILSRVERNGVLLDTDLLDQQSTELDKKMRELEQQAHGLAGETFNLGSPKQIQDIFFNKLELPILKKTPKGQPSTAEPVLQELALDYPLPKVILEYRSLSKLKSTYTDQLPKQVHQTTGRVHTSYRQAVAATGRLSSTDPNLQNIPIRTEEGRRVRKAFIAPKGYVLVAADYSQIELRIMAHLSNDVGLVSAFNQDLDIHKATAAEVFGVDVEDVKDFQRRNAKAINFGLIYGMSAFGLSRQLNISRGDAEEYISLYFERYPGVRNYMDRIRILAAEQGYVETIFGRRLYLPEINAKNFQRRQAAERTAINAPMQGSAADIIKRAMIAVDSWLTTTGMNARMIMQVHDELVLEVEEDSQEELVAAVSKHMEAAAQLSIPLLVETGVGHNWDDAH
jgi:DNA polymerase-1